MQALPWPGPCVVMGVGGPHAGGNQSMWFSHIDVSLHFSFSLLLSLKINGKISLGEDLKKKKESLMRKS